MSLIRCENCGGEWFKQETHVTLADEPFAEGGVPYPEERQWVFRCGECGDLLDLERYQVGAAFRPPT